MALYLKSPPAEFLDSLCRRTSAARSPFTEFEVQKSHDRSVDESRFEPFADGAISTDAVSEEEVRVKIRASLDEADQLQEVHSWLDRWKPTLRHCQQSGGVWDERYEVVAPKFAVKELPRDLVREVIAETIESNSR